MIRFLSLLAASFLLQPAAFKTVRVLDILLASAIQAVMVMAIVAADGGGLTGVPLASILAFAVAAMLSATPSLAENARSRLHKLLPMQFIGSSGVLLVYWILRSIDVKFHSSGYFLVVGHFLGLLYAVWMEPAEVDDPTAGGDDGKMDAMLRSMRSAQIVELGPTMGSIQDHPIPQWIKLSTGRVLMYKCYVGNSVCEDQFGSDGVLIAPGLLYGDTGDER